MELTPKQQITELIKNKKKILLLTHMNPDGDALGSIIALYLVLVKLGKEITMVCPMTPPGVFRFLPEIEKVKSNFENSKDFVITLDSSQVEVERLGYKNNSEERKLNIVITPRRGTFSPEDVSFSYGVAKYDLIFVLDSADLDRLSYISEENPEIFYETPVVNIDHHPSNDYFGKINWVDITATSTAEILVSLIESLGREAPLLDENIATCLLTGIITDTGSFQNQNTTPKSFTVAAQLVAAGARQQEIIQNIFRTKRLSTLKIWGKILGAIRHEENHQFVWSKASKDDLTNYGAQDDETSGVIDELLKTVPNIDFALLLTERKEGVHGSLRGVGTGVNVVEIARLFKGGGHELAAAFHVPNTTLVEIEQEIIARIKHFQENKMKLGSAPLAESNPITDSQNKDSDMSTISEQGHSDISST